MMLMRKVALLGAIFLGLSGVAGARGFHAGDALLAHQAAHRSYWWPAMDNCTITTGVYRNGSLRAVPYVQCLLVSAHYGKKPPPQMAGIPVNSPQIGSFDQNYCPFKPNGWCTPPSN